MKKILQRLLLVITPTMGVKKLFNFLKLWPELFSIPLGLFVFYTSPVFIRWIDPFAATFDVGVLQNIVFAIVALLFFNAAVFLGMKFNFPGVYNWYKEWLTADVVEPKENEIKLFLWVYFGLLFALVFVFKVI
jgi:hypothetical protein